MTDDVTSPQVAPQKGDANYVDYIVALSQRGFIRKGIINEPRCFYDLVDLHANRTVTFGTPGVLVNGEQFPVRLTHMLASVAYLNNVLPTPAVDDEINAQRIAMRLKFHDQYYMNAAFLPLPIWGNKVVAAADSVSPGTSHWDFVANGQPFVLSARDTLLVSLNLNDFANPVSAVPVTVAVTGFGALSHRPYLLSSQVLLSTVIAVNMSTVDFRNDGSEPIIITDMTVNVAGEIEDADAIGSIGRVSIQIRQIGNGTNANWFDGPPTNPGRMQATLLGVTSGRAVVHQFPGDGLLWEPGEGITLEAQLLAPNVTSRLTLGFSGYIMVT
jgi:hypothetical protein